MERLLRRLLVAALCMAAGALAGFIAHGNRSTVVGALIGAVVGLASVVVFDGLRGWRLMRWLRDTRGHPAPRDAVFWGETAFLIERALRTLERSAEVERPRLSQFVSAMEAS